MRYQGLGDVELMALVALGHESALESLYDRYARLVYSLALRLLSDPAAAEEVVQDVFLSAWRRASSYNPGYAKVSTWLSGIAHHRAVDQLRRRRARPQQEEYQDGVNPGSTLAGSDDPEEAAMESALSQQVRKGLEQLPREQREVIDLAYFQGYTHVEIARRLQQPLGTVKTRMRLGVQRLRESMAPLIKELP